MAGSPTMWADTLLEICIATNLIVGGFIIVGVSLTVGVCVTRLIFGLCGYVAYVWTTLMHGDEINPEFTWKENKRVFKSPKAQALENVKLFKELPKWY